MDLDISPDDPDYMAANPPHLLELPYHGYDALGEPIGAKPTLDVSKHDSEAPNNLTGWMVPANIKHWISNFHYLHLRAIDRCINVKTRN